MGAAALRHARPAGFLRVGCSPPWHSAVTDVGDRDTDAVVYPAVTIPVLSVDPVMFSFLLE